ncbi:MAG: alpha/beta fold hydrolase, partial [Alphaproteobacteria bacterium]
MPLFPATDAFATHMLPVGQGHTLYIEQSGNPSGIPVIVLHGGPGSGFSPTTHRRFNPAVYHIVCFDQRGAGKSTPSGSFDANITPYLVQDVAAVLAHLGIAQAVLYGTSWGSTLALAFAQANPEKVLGMVLGGIFLGTQEELEWVNLPTGMARLR